MRSAVKFQEGICKKQRRSLQELGEIYAISCFDSQKHMTGGRRMETLFFSIEHFKQRWSNQGIFHKNHPSATRFYTICYSL